MPGIGPHRRAARSRARRRQTGRRAACDTPSSVRRPRVRTCQNAVLPEKKATFPPPAMCASTVSRMPHDQYSSWPTLSSSWCPSTTLGSFVEIGVDREVERVPVALGPRHEHLLPARPARAARPGRDARVEDVARPTLGLGIGCRIDVRVAVRERVRTMDIAPRPRSGERHLRLAGVQVRATPVVVRVPRVGRQHEQHRRAGLAGRRTNHEPCV